MRFMLLAILLCVAPMPSSATTPSPSEARRMLRYPKGSLSLGFTNSGKLLNGAQLPPQGKGYRIFSSFVERSTNHGTAELIGLIKRAGRTLSRLHPGAVIGVGNLSREGGGQTGSSVSHKSGRDADLGMFALTKKGQSKNLGSFVSFERDGWDKRKRYQFDPVRNLDLVLALIEDKKSFVQVIFVADWLKAIVLEEARSRGLAAERLAKIDTVLKQPSDSNPHHHHYHVRLYCSIEDRLHGCLERGDSHPWIDHGEERFKERVRQLTSLLSMEQTKWRHAAVKRLGELRAVEAIGPLIKSAEDSSQRVALASLDAIGNLAHPDAFPMLTALLHRTVDSKRVIGILGAMLRIELPELEQSTLAFLQRVEAGKYAQTKSAKRDLRIKALEILQRFGRKESFKTVLGYLEHDDPKLLRAVHRTLRRITNQPIKGRFKSPRQRRSLRAKWHVFRDKYQAKSWSDWIRLGFLARGVKLDAGDDASRPLLVKQLTHRDDDAAHNAALALMKQTGHTAYPWWRKKRNNRRHWESWFRANSAAEKTR